MELWIRSQDKDVLQKTTNIYVHDNYVKTYDNANSCEIYLGIYKTKERALEVLDEIQRHLVVINDDNTFYVYEMPKE